MAPCLRHQGITCTNADFSFVRFSGIHLITILQRVLQLLISIMGLIIHSDDYWELNGNKSVLIRMKVWCHQAPSCTWANVDSVVMSSCGVTKPQWWALMNKAYPSQLSVSFTSTGRFCQWRGPCVLGSHAYEWLMMSLPNTSRSTNSSSGTISSMFVGSSDSIYRCLLSNTGNPIVEIRRSKDLISTMGFPILVRWHLYIEPAPRTLKMLCST